MTALREDIQTVQLRLRAIRRHSHLYVLYIHMWTDIIKGIINASIGYRKYARLIIVNSTNRFVRPITVAPTRRLHGSSM